MRKKIFLTAAFIVSLIPMVANQFGLYRGVNEVSGLINLWNPIGIIAVIVYLIGVWFPFKNNKINGLLGLAGLIGIIISEIYNFLTWQGIGFDLGQSFNGAFPEFYLGLITSVLMIVIYICALCSTSDEPRHARAGRTTTTVKTASKPAKTVASKGAAKKAAKKSSKRSRK